jgi:hypothetical protein
MEDDSQFGPRNLDKSVRLNTAHPIYCVLGSADMKKTKRKRATAREGASGGPGGPTKKRLTHIARDVMAQERRDRRSLDLQAERAVKAKRRQP